MASGRRSKDRASNESVSSFGTGKPPTAADAGVLTSSSLREVTYSALPRVIDIWRTLDSDKSGHIALAEFTRGLTTVFPDAKNDDIVALFRECDLDGNGTVEYAELVQTMRQANRSHKAAEAPRGAPVLAQSAADVKP